MMTRTLIAGILRTMQRSLRGDGCSIIGRVAVKGLTEELQDRDYLVIDGANGKAPYLALNASEKLANYPTCAAVEVKGSADLRAADTNIVALASDG